MKKSTTQEQLNIQGKRHTLAHLLASTVRELYPGSQNAIGPAIDDGFYQDFDLPQPISENELPKIEKAMRQKLKNWQSSEKKQVTIEQAKKEFAWNTYKSELIDEFSDQGKTITFYTLGDFLDLCKGGHSENPAAEIDPASFKLSRIAGAYWRGNENNKMLTRIYGLAFDTKEQLSAYQAMLEEAKKRDHKKLGVQLDLFTFSDLVGPGLPLWTPRGTLVRNLVSDYVWQLRKARGYQRVEIPHITKKDLYQISGHWDKFKDELFRITTREGHEFAMKPMNCPHHTQIYARTQHSYRELPLRYENATMCYRDEQSGELSGLSRVRAFTQDDAHVFARFSQIKQEFNQVWDIIEAFYGTAGLALTPELSFSDPNNQDKYLGTRETWDKAEAALNEIVKERKVEAEISIGEAAFYGPKIDFIAKDSIGRQWQVATIQLDMNMPERFDLTCINEQGQTERIVMIHAAIMGSIERFLSVYIEHIAGLFPVWLSPVQVKLLPISANQVEAAEQMKQQILDICPEARIEIDDRDESLGKKIREAGLEKIPYMAVIGEKEAASQTLAIRARGNNDLGQMTVLEFSDRLSTEIKNKS